MQPSLLRSLVLGGLLSFALGATPALAQDEADALRASKLVGEQADGYLGSPPGVAVPPDLAARLRQINIQRRAYYTDIAAKRGANVNEVAMATACQLLSTKVDTGEWYQKENGSWTERQAGEPVQLPAICGK